MQTNIHFITENGEEEEKKKKNGKLFVFPDKRDSMIIITRLRKQTW